MNLAVKATDIYVGYATQTAPRTVTLPAASAYLYGQLLWIADEIGGCSTDEPIIVDAAGSDTIAGQPSVLIANPYGKLAFQSNGTNLWTL